MNHNQYINFPKKILKWNEIDYFLRTDYIRFHLFFANYFIISKKVVIYYLAIALFLLE